MNIALRTPNWIGDCLMSLSAIKLLKENYPESKIFVFTKPHLADIYKNLEEVHNIFLIPSEINFKNIVNFKKIISKIKFKYGILFTNSFSSALIFKLLGIPVLIGYKNEFRGLFLKHKIKIPSSISHYVTYYNKIIKILIPDISVEASYKLFLKFSEEEILKINLIMKQNQINQNFIGLSPFAAFGKAKEWPYFQSLIKVLKDKCPDFSIVVFGGSNDRTESKELMEKLKNYKKIYNFTGKLSLRESMCLISQSKLFISNDSGLMHVAANLSIPTIGIFGSTPYQRTLPLNKKSRYIIKKVDCSPCKYRECPKNHECMKAISVDEVMNLVRELM